MITGALLALFWAVLVLLGGMGALVFILGMKGLR